MLPRLHAALKPGGMLGLCWNVFGDTDVHTDFRDRVDVIAREAGMQRKGTADALDIASWQENLAGGGWFERAVAEVFRWSIDLTTAQVRDLFSTFSGWAGVPDRVDLVAAAADECGGVVTEHYLTVLYLAARSPSR